MTGFTRLAVAIAILTSAYGLLSARAEPPASDKQADLDKVHNAVGQLLGDLGSERTKLHGMGAVFSKKGSASGTTEPQPVPQPQPRPQPRPQPVEPQPQPGPPVSAVVMSPAVATRVQEEFGIASKSLDDAEEALRRALQATDPSVALSDMRDGMSKLQQARNYRSRVQSVVSPEPDQIRSVAPQRVPGGQVIVPARQGLVYGASGALAQAQGIDLLQGGDVRNQAFENRGFSQPANPVEFKDGIVTINTGPGRQIDVRPLTDALDKVTGGGTNFFQVTPVGKGEAVRADPDGVAAVNDPKTREELEKVGGVALKVTLDLLSF